MGAQGMAIGGTNMWDLLLDQDPGHSAAAGDLAVDVVDRKLKQTAAVIPVEVAKPAKRGNMVQKEKKKGAAADYKQAASVHNHEVQMNGARSSKQAPAVASVPDGDKMTNGPEELKETLSALPNKQAAVQEEAKEEEVFEVVAARGRSRQTVAGQTRKAEAPAAAVTASNMWAVLSDDDPGNTWAVLSDDDPGNTWAVLSDDDPGNGGGIEPVKQGKKTRAKKKKNAARGSKKEEEMQVKRGKKTKAATLGSQCRSVASLMFWGALAVATLILYFPADA